MVVAAVTAAGEGFEVEGAVRRNTGVGVLAIVGEFCATCCRDCTALETSVTAVGGLGATSALTCATASVLVCCLATD